MLQNLCRSLKNVRTYVALAIVLAVGCLACYLAAPTRSSLSHRFLVGQRLVYRLEYLSASASNFAGLTQDADAGEKQAIFTNVEADLEATVVEVNADGASIAFTLRDPQVRVVVNGDLALPQAEAIQADLGRTILASVDEHGPIRAVHFDPRVASLAHSFARALLAATQVVLPDDATRTAWETREHDPNGEHTVRYQREASSAVEPNIAVISKERTQYAPAERSQSIRMLQVDSVTEPSGKLTIRFDESAGHVVAMEGREETTIHVNHKTVARAETTVKMNFLRAETLDAAAQRRLHQELASLQAESGVPLSAAAANTAQAAAIHRNELGDATVDSLLAELASFDARADSKMGDTKFYFKLKALVYLHPEACPQLAKVLSGAKAESRTMQLLTDALSSVGHAQAQSALEVAIRAYANDAPALGRLVPALAMVEAPTQAAEETLREVAVKNADASIRQGAELGLGTMAHQLAAADPARSGRIARTMADKLQTASNPEARQHLLFVLGNAGIPETFDVIVPFLKDSTPAVRAAAAAALRWIKAASADELLCRTLANDADAAVRVEAATALSFRTMTATSFAAQKAVFCNDESSSVRVAVLQNLARAQTAFPEARAILRQAASDPSEAVREEAEGLLAID